MMADTFMTGSGLSVLDYQWPGERARHRRKRLGAVSTLSELFTGAGKTGFSFMSLLPRPYLRFLLVFALAALAAPVKSLALSCTMQAQMTDAARNDLIQAAKKLATSIQGADITTVRALTIGDVAAHFDPIASSIQELAPQIAGAVITIDALYGLDASDLKAAQDQAQFFCNTAGSALHEEISILQLPPGNYALVLVHATGVAHPQQMAFLLMNKGAWQLAGFFFRPLLVDGHDSLWYWTRARQFAQKGQKWNAYFYLTTADYLSSPVDFLNTPNSEKLAQEQAAAMPQGLPGDQPMVVKAAGESYSITNLHTDGSLGGLDLVIHYTAVDTRDPVATRARNLELMKAILTEHPELRDGFHGLWVFADAPSQRPFGIEQPMSALH
jgi:hypothetical protein